MADAADTADLMRDTHLARALSRIDPRIPAGVRGECDECGEDMPRLVNGRCGYCRDGRRPPLDRYPVTPITPPKPKENIMANPPPSADRRQISFPAAGPVLQAIMARVDAGSSIASATLELLEKGIAPPAIATPAAPAVSLADWETDDLLAEIRDRATGGGRVRDLERALAEHSERLKTADSRAAEAEARLARVSAVLTGAA